MPGLKFRLFASLLVFISLGVQVYGQAPLAKRNWYFGNSAFGLRFARPDYDVTLDSTNMIPPFSRFGNATASSPETGDLLFYTDGQFVYDASFQLMDGIIGGNAAFELNADVNKNQNTAIVSTPGDDDRYIIFTNTVANTLNFSVVDLSAPGNAIFPQPNLGSVGPFNQNIASSSAIPSDAMLALAKADLSGYWLITADLGTNIYKVLDINGVDPTAWTEQQYTLGNSLNAAHMAYSEANGKIAVAPSSSNTNIHILDFDAAAGTLALDTVVLNSGNADQLTEAIYDVEWSPDGSKLYVSRYGGSANVGDLLQWDATLPSSSSLVSVLPAQVFGSYGLQTGPDNIIYHLYQEFNGGPYLLASLSDADSIPTNVRYNPQVFGGQDFNSHQFPALLPPRATPLAVDFEFAGLCANTATTFYPLISPAPDSVFWDFGDGTGSSGDLSPLYTYTGGGSYNVTLFAALNGQIAQASKPVNITQFDLQLTLVADTVACSCELPVNGLTCTPFSVAVQANNEPPGTSYLWSNGDIGQVLTPDSAGYYYVIATDPISGCTAHAGVNVSEYGVPDQRANVWYFGTNAGIDFNEVPPLAISDGIMDAPEGCTAISDRNGAVLFYTDGDAVYIKDRITGVHSQIDIGIGGDPLSAQSVIAVPFTNDETLYYIFTTEEVGSGTGNFEFKFSVYDLKLNNGTGGIAEKDITLFTRSTERITANGNWVIIHEYGNNNFRAYPITATGLGSPVVTSMGSDHSFTDAAYGQGYMKFSSIGDKLAVALAESSNGPNYVEVFEWDNGNGQVTDFRRLDLTADGAVGQVYGVEFAPGDVKLYATVINAGAGSSMIMEYRADTLDLMQHIPPIMTSGGELGAIQLAPNGQLLVAVDGASSLGAIQVNPDTIGASTYIPNGFPLAGGTTSGLGLPNYAASFGSALQTPSFFVSSPVCVGQPVNMVATTTSVIDTAYWQIADGGGNIVFTSPNLADTTTLNVAGDYLVSLLIGNRCGFNTAFSQTITVNPPPPTSSLPPGLPICGASAVLEVYNVDPPNINDFTFLWSTGETTEAITVNSLGTYDVVMTDTTSGCITTASVFVGPPFIVDLGPDQNTCETDPLILDSQANANLYNWFIDNNPVAPANNQRNFDFGAQALPAGVYTVRVEVEDPVDPTCFVVDEAIITVNAIPAFTATEFTPVSACGLSDGVMEINVTSTGNFTFVVSGPTPILDTPITGPGTAQVPALAAGVYVVTVTNNVSACTEQLSNIVITEPVPFNIINPTTVDNGCSGATGQINFELDAAVGAIDWLVRDQNGAAVLTGSDNSAGPADIINITGLNDGTYSLEVSGAGAGGCTDSEIGIIINPTPITDLQTPLSIAECGTTLDLQPYVSSATAGAVITYSIDNGVTFNPIATPLNQLGNFPIQFMASNLPTTCDSLYTVDVTLVPTPSVTVQVDSTNICNGSVVLTAVGDGGYAGAPLSYRWSTGQTSQSITVSSSGPVDVYATNALNLSCFGQETVTVNLPVAFTVTLSSTLACDDGSPFTLTATATNTLVDYTWYLNGIELPDKTSQIQSINAGLFEVEVTDQGVGSCSNTATLNVVKAPVTATDLSSAVVFCPDEGDIILDAGSDFISYLWSTGESTQTIMVSQEGEYSVSATNNFNCVTDDRSDVLADCIPKVYGPTAFKPGGLNSEFYLFSEYVQDFEIFIYNRWGSLVFQSNDLNFRWDGTFGGELQPAGQYSYVVRYTSSFRDRGTLEQYGGVILLR